MPTQEERDRIRTERNEKQRAYRDALRAQREWKEETRKRRPLMVTDKLAQKHYEKEMRGRTGLAPVDTSEQA